MTLIISRKEVESSNIKSVGYSTNAKILEIEFNKKNSESIYRVYRYYDVPKSLHMNMMQADSMGKFLYKHVFGVFTFEEIT